MNERIKELAEQAMNYATDRLSQTHGSGPDFVNDFREKFAELIVGECMRMCDVAAIGYESHNHNKEANGCYSAKEYIADWFEVEE